MTNQVNMRGNEDYKKYRRLLEKTEEKHLIAKASEESLKKESQKYKIICDNMIALECSLIGIINPSSINCEIDREFREFIDLDD